MGETLETIQQLTSHAEQIENLFYQVAIQEQKEKERSEKWVKEAELDELNQWADQLNELAEAIQSTAERLNDLINQAGQTHDWFGLSNLAQRKEGLASNKKLTKQAKEKFKTFREPYLEQITLAADALDQTSRLIHALKGIELLLAHLGYGAETIDQIVRRRDQFEAIFKNAQGKYDLLTERFKTTQGAFVAYLNEISRSEVRQTDSGEGALKLVVMGRAYGSSERRNALVRSVHAIRSSIANSPRSPSLNSSQTASCRCEPQRLTM